MALPHNLQNVLQFHRISCYFAIPFHIANIFSPQHMESRKNHRNFGVLNFRFVFAITILYRASFRRKKLFFFILLFFLITGELACSRYVEDMSIQRNLTNKNTLGKTPMESLSFNNRCFAYLFWFWPGFRNTASQTFLHKFRLHFSLNQPWRHAECNKPIWKLFPNFHQNNKITNVTWNYG